MRPWQRYLPCDPSFCCSPPRPARRQCGPLSSGSRQPGDLHNAYEAGFDLHLAKPVSPKFLHDVMNALTSKGQVKG
jgi:hypothetical protein